MRRRRLLGTAAAFLAGAGCTTDGTGDTSPMSSPAPASATGSPTPERDEPSGVLGEFYLTNGADTTHTFETTVERQTDEGDDEGLLDQTYDLTAGATERFQNVITETGSFRIRVEADTGAATTYTWSIPRCDDYDYLRIRFFEGDLRVDQKRQTIVPPPTCARYSSNRE